MLRIKNKQNQPRAVPLDVVSVTLTSLSAGTLNSTTNIPVSPSATV